MLLGEFAVVSHLRIFSLELLDQPRSQWPAQVALREKSWDDTHFKLVAVNTTVSYYLWDDTTTSSHICPNSIICPHHGNNTMYLNGQGRPHTWPVFSNRLRDLYFPTCRTGSWVDLFWFLLILVLLFNIWLSVKWQVRYQSPLQVGKYKSLNLLLKTGQVWVPI